MEGLLLVEAHNAFNSLNGAVMLQNMQVTCPSLAVPVINMYRSDAELFEGQETIFSRDLEGTTTQGDPLSMALYALSTLPLISKISPPNFTQTWFADDAGRRASLQVLHQRWTALSEVGPRYGYYVNSPKKWLLVKEQYKDSAQELFGKYGIQITIQGRPLLGAPFGTADRLTQSTRASEKLATRSMLVKLYVRLRSERRNIGMPFVWAIHHQKRSTFTSRKSRIKLTGKQCQ